jgi:hypothetical protein
MYLQYGVLYLILTRPKFAVRYREVSTADLYSSGTGMWAQQLYAAQVQGGGQSSSM